MRYRGIVLVVVCFACRASAEGDFEKFSETLNSGSEQSRGCSYSAITQKNFFSYQVDQKAAIDVGSVMPRYPQALRESGLTGEVVARFAVDTMGKIDPCTFRVLETTHKQFAKAVEAVLPDIRFSPAIIRGMKVRQVVEHRFTFDIKDAQ